MIFILNIKFFFQGGSIDICWTCINRVTGVVLKASVNGQITVNCKDGNRGVDISKSTCKIFWALLILVKCRINSRNICSVCFWISGMILFWFLQPFKTQQVDALIVTAMFTNELFWRLNWSGNKSADELIYYLILCT